MNSTLKPEMVIKSGVSVDWLEFTLFNKKPEVLEGENIDMIEAMRDRYTSKDEDFEKYKKLMEKHRPDDFEEEMEAYESRPFYVPDVCKLLGIYGYEPEEQKTGAQGYRMRHITIAGIVILSEGQAEMGVHVTVSGSVCQHIEDIVGLIKTVKEAGAKFTRVDLAIDDCDGALDLPQMVAKCRAGECSSKLKTFLVMEGGKIKDGTPTGLTLYIGKRVSDFMCRAYDKRLESIYEKHIDAALIPSHWIRVEMECKGAAANNAAARLLDSGLTMAVLSVAILKNYINFKDRTTDDNKSRWPVCDWWQAFVDGAERLSISRQIIPSDLDKRMTWFKRQCSKPVAMLLKSYGPEEMTAAVESAEKALTQTDRDNIKLHRKKVERKREHERARTERAQDNNET